MAFSFEKTLEKESGCTLVVDALNLAFRWKHQGKTDFREEYLSTVQSLARSYKCDNVIITADWGSSSYRKALFPEYKGNREAMRAEQTEAEAQAFREFFVEYEASLERMKGLYPILKYKGVEADDIAAHIVRNLCKYEINKVWLVSSDRDWDLLIKDNVSRFSYVTRKETTVDNWSDHYDVSIEEYISLKCLQGDSGDNVPGIKGIGPKRAKGLIDTYGDAMSIYDACPIPGSYVFIQNLNRESEQILLNYELMDLLTYCDEAIGQENINDIQQRLVNAN